MFSPSGPLLLLIFVSLSVVVASPVSRHSGRTSLRFAAKTNVHGTGLNVAERDRTRTQAMIRASRLGKRAPFSVSVANGVTGYTVQVGVGTPPTSYTLLLDTGSSNTWVGASKPYTPTSSSIDTGNFFSVEYDSGNVTGKEWIDTVTLSNVAISNQYIGVASADNGFSGVDGILGVGPTDLSAGTVTNILAVPTVTDSLLLQGTISEEVLGVYFIPSSEDDSAGTLTFGEYDSSVITGSVNYVPLTTALRSAPYWGIDQSVSYGGHTILPLTAGIVDTGTTFILLATNAYEAYRDATGGVLDQATGLLSITPDQYNRLQTLSFHIGGTTYDLSPNAQIWPRSLNSGIGGSSNSIYLVVSDIGSPSGSGFDFNIGYTFLERYYSVYDTTNRRVGFATTAYTNSQNN